MYKRLVIIIGLIFVFSFSCYADDSGLNNKKDLPKFCEVILDHFQKEEIHKAYTLLKANYPFPSEMDSAELKTIQQWEIIKSRYGVFRDTKLVKSEEILDTGIIKYLYIMRFDNNALRFMFVFYNSKSKWIINSFTFDDKVVNLFSF